MNQINPLDDIVAQSVCPLCRTQVVFAPGSTRCPRCGLDVTDDRAIQLHQLNMRIGVDSAHRHELEMQLRSELGNVPPLSPVPAVGRGWPLDASQRSGATPVASHEVSEISARNVILGVGVALLGIALAVFVAVTWPRLDAVGRVAFLIVATAAVLGATTESARRQLASTTEALASLSVILLIANSYAIRQGWFLDSDGLLYWSAAVTIVVASVWAFNVAVSAKALTISALVGAQFPVVLAALSFADRGTDVGVVLVAQAVATSAFGRRRDEFMVRLSATLSASLFVLGALVAFSYMGDSADAARVEVGLGLVVVLLTAALAWLQVDDNRATLYWAASVLGLAASAFEIITQTFDESVQLVVGAAVLLAVVVVWTVTSGALRRGAIGVLGGLNALLVLPIVGTLFTVAVLPFSWLNFVWQLPSDAIARDRVGAFTETCFGRCPAVAETRYESWQGNWWQIFSLALLTAAAGVICTGVKRMEVRKTLVLVGLGAAAWLGVIGVGATHMVTMLALVLLVLTTMAVSFLLTINAQNGAIVGATAVTVNVLAWTLAAQSTSLVVFPALAVGLVVLAVVAVVRSRVEVSYALSALGLGAIGGCVAVIGRDQGWNWPSVGVALGVVYGLVYLVSLMALNQERHGRLALVIQACAAAGLFVGIAQQDKAAPTAMMLAGATLLALASALRRQHVAYWAATATLGLASIWAALVDQGISVLQAYTVPLAVVLLLFGHGLLRGERNNSWSRYGAGVLTLVGAALAEALETETLGYLGWATAVALGVLLVGVSLRLQAPLTVGAAGLVAIGIRLLGPYADEIPRWIVLGVPGLLLIVVGATWEQRRADVNKLVAAYQKLG